MSRLPPDVLSFLRRADRMLTDAEASASADEEMPQGMRHEVVDNVVQQLAGSELASACHVFGSSALQRAMRLGSIPQRVALATPMLCAAPTHVLTDKYASHVIETILSLVHLARSTLSLTLSLSLSLSLTPTPTLSLVHESLAEP